MAAPKGNKNAKGNKGGGAPTLQDRELSARVRALALEQIEEVLTGKLYPKDYRFQQQLLLKLASTVLPRINELTGEGGGSINVNVVSYGNNTPAFVPTAGISASAT